VMENSFHTVRGYQLIEQNKRNLTSAMEDYLEMIYRNSMEEGYLRIGTLAKLLNVSAPSASKMVQRLSELGLVKFQKYGIIMMNDSGKVMGEYLLERHELLENFLRLMDCGDDLLQQTELMEHDITPQLLENIKLLNNFFMDNEEIMLQYNKYKYNHKSQQQRKE
jgi:DtxR family Mn-dependent transcriptional regulator